MKMKVAAVVPQRRLPPAATSRQGEPSMVAGSRGGVASILSSNMRVFRWQRKLTQEEAAFRAHIDYKQWQRIEAGKANVTLVTLGRIADILETSTSALICSNGCQCSLSDTRINSEGPALENCHPRATTSEDQPPLCGGGWRQPIG